MVALSLLLAAVCQAAQMAPPRGLIAEGHDSRIDLVWDRVSDTDQDPFNVYRSDRPDGPWTKLNARPHRVHVCSDFIGQNGKTFYDRVTRLAGGASPIASSRTRRHASGGLSQQVAESPPSAPAHATTREMDDEQLLDSIEKACFRYFWDFGHPVSGLAREGLLHGRHVVTTGGIGFGMITIMAAAARGFVSRSQAAHRLLKMTIFLQEKARRYQGLWPHHLRGDTGETLPFAGKEDNESDIVESASLMQGSADRARILRSRHGG